MKLLVILFVVATLSTFTLAFPQSDDDNKNATTTTTSTTTASTVSNVTNATTAATPTLAPFAPEARSDTGKPRANLKGKPLIKTLPKAKRKKLQLKPAHPQKQIQTHKRNPKPLVAKAPPTVQPVEPQRRDSPGYAAPSYAAPQREVIIQQAGPSQEYGWVGHGNGYNAPHNLQNPFPAHLTKWILQNNKIFEAGLLYPGAPGSSYSPPPPPPAAPPTYNAPASPPEITYDAPSSYNVPVIPSTSSYNSPPAPAYEPAPAPAYVAPVEAPAVTYEAAQPTYGVSQPVYEAPQPTYNAAPEVPSYNVAVQAPASYDSVAVAPSYNVQQVPVDQYGAAVVSASYSSADGSLVDAVPATYDAATFPPPFYSSVNPANVAYKVAEPASTYEAAAPPASYEAAAPFPAYGAASAPASYEAAAPQNYGPPLIYEVAAPASYYGPSAPPTTYEAAAPVQTYEAAVPVESYVTAAPVQSYEAAAPVQSYEAAAPVQSYEAAAPPPSSYGTVVQVPSAYDAPLSSYVTGQPAYEEPAAPAPTYSKYGAAAPPVGSFDTDAVPISYDAPAQDDQSLYNLYTPPNEQPEYQASADNSYSVPSFYDVGKPGNFPTYNNIPAADSYGAPQEVYEVPIKVEETYQAAQQEKAPEVFYIFYENQEPAVAAQVRSHF